MIKKIDTGIKFVILIHPKEARKQRTGTGRLTALSLKDSELISGVDFTKQKKVNDLIQNPEYFPVVLYPGEDALNAKSGIISEKIETRKLLVFIIDATWSLAHKIMNLSENLQQLPKLSFYGSYTSQFKIKKQPQFYCLSTIESVYYLIKELKDQKIINSKIKQNKLLILFKKMIRIQIRFRKKRLKINRPDSFHHR